MSERVNGCGGKIAIAIGRVQIDLTRRTVTDPLGGRQHLTPTERDILRLLDVRRGEVVSHDAIIEEIRGEGYACDNNALYVHLANLRRKLGPAGACLVSRRGAGYELL